jgi:hypothetical protein
MAGIHRAAADTGESPARKLAATAAILRQILAPIGDDLVGACAAEWNRKVA